MPFKVIPGTYLVVGFAPDGDSIRFKPDHPEQLHDLDNVPAKLKPAVQLRIEAIDTLETHYSLKSGPTVHQPPAHAESARSALLDFLGIRNVVWGADGKVASADDGTRGYILARAFEKNGRLVSFVFAGDPPGAGEAFLDVPRLRTSYNFMAIAKGLAYPTFYHGLFADLRKELALAAADARAARLGVYADDRTGAGFAVNALSDITETHVILPKLFRRLAEYVAVHGNAAGFKAALEQAREPVLDLRNDANFTHFDTFVTESGTKITLTRNPEELVFDPMPARPSDAFARMLETKAPSRAQVFVGAPAPDPAPASA